MNAGPRSETPSRWVARFAPLIVAGGEVLDLACGQGRHCRWLAARGWRVTGVDRDGAAIAALRDVEAVTAIEADLERDRWPLAGRRFDGVVVVNYLHRPLLPVLLGALADDGVLIYETFAAGNAAYGRPANPDFLLAPGELLAAMAGRLTIVGFEQGVVGGERPAVIQRIAAVGRGRAWPPSLPPPAG